LPEAADANDPSEAAVEDFARAQWAQLVAAVVAGGDTGVGPQQPQASLTVSSVLERTGVLQDGRLTTNGFQFLLKDRRAQVWTLLSACVDVGSTEAIEDSTLALLLRMAFLRPGVAHSAAAMGRGQCRVLGELAELGLLVYQPARQRFFISRTLHKALQPRTCALNVGAEQQQQQPRREGIIVEANFRVYVLTDSPTLVSLVRLFATPMQRLPGLFVATITRASVRRALLNGITAAQIVAFLHKNAHPSAASLPQVVPGTVVDQIELWERERSRISFEPAVMLDAFPTKEHFAQFRARAARQRALLWASDRQQRLLVTRDFYFAQQKQQQQQQQQGIT